MRDTARGAAGECETDAAALGVGRVFHAVFVLVLCALYFVLGSLLKLARMNQFVNFAQTHQRTKYKAPSTNKYKARLSKPDSLRQSLFPVGPANRPRTCRCPRQFSLRSNHARFCYGLLRASVRCAHHSSAARRFDRNDPELPFV